MLTQRQDGEKGNAMWLIMVVSSDPTMIPDVIKAKDQDEAEELFNSIIGEFVRNNDWVKYDAVYQEKERTAEGEAKHSGMVNIFGEDGSETLFYLNEYEEG